MHGRYPKAFVGEPPLDVMGFKAGDEKLLYAPLDWVGFHYYTRRVVSMRARRSSRMEAISAAPRSKAIRQAVAILTPDSAHDAGRGPADGSWP